jgi:hypothetical protein
MLDVFHVLIAIHIVLGAVGLVSFWPPVIGRKGGPLHVAWGRTFARVILGAGTVAVGLATCTLIDPLGTHPHLKDAAFVRGIFGVMMLHLAVLTINLAWHGRRVVLNRADHAANRKGLGLWLQPLLLATSVACAIEGLLIDQPLMLGMAVVGVATAWTNLAFILDPKPGPRDWLREHVKAIVGAGISVYTAFFAFGAVRIMPTLALNPILWSIPLLTGLGIILYHWRKMGVRLPAWPRP